MSNLIKEFFITKDFTLFIILIVVYIIYFIKNKYFKKLVQWIIKRTPSTLDDDLFPLVNQLINVLLFGSAIITALIKLGFNVNALVTACGAGSLAIALAVKDSIANILSGFIIMIDRPFQIGDNIVFNNEELIVHDIGLRRSRFIAKDRNKAILVVPNTDLVKARIYNFSMTNRIK